MSRIPMSESRSLRVTIHWTRILCRPSHILLTLYKDLVASCNSSNNINTMVVAILDAFWRSNDFTPLKSASAQVNAALGKRYRMPICIAESKTNTFSRRAIGVEILAALLQGLVVLLWWELEEHQAALPHQCWCSNFHYHHHCFPCRITIWCLSNCLSTNACNMLNCTALWAYLPCWTCLGTVDNMLYLWNYGATAVANVCCTFIFPLEQCIVAGRPCVTQIRCQYQIGRLLPSWEYVVQSYHHHGEGSTLSKVTVTNWEFLLDAHGHHKGQVLSCLHIWHVWGKVHFCLLQLKPSPGDRDVMSPLVTGISPS